jgi:hypothetical protein
MLERGVGDAHETATLGTGAHHARPALSSFSVIESSRSLGVERHAVIAGIARRILSVR